MEIAQGDFIAIFDSDFLPEQDFLLKVLPYFDHENIGVVQTKWQHLNENSSLLTQLQSFGLDAHFSVEQVGRNISGHFINFNGTAGVWRKTCIEDAGGWQSDTLTEDLDLSYRAQLKGWKFKYIESIGAPAELPIAMNALKGQQFRWTKGAAETAKKILPAVLKSPLSNSTKIHAFFHLMNSSIFVCILGCALLSIPILIIKHSEKSYDSWFTMAGIFSISFVILMVYYGASYFHNKKFNFRNLFFFLGKYLIFLSVSMGLCVHNSIAVLQAWFGIKTAFIRTPKLNLIGSKTNNQNLSKLPLRLSLVQIFEALLLVYAIIGLLLGITFREFGLFPFHLMLTFGLGYVLILSIIHGRKYSTK
jgi:cellulose synthase/poly-beta-1,6-N-acetylglucosamine synthase-like glycosyltransferase